MVQILTNKGVGRNAKFKGMTKSYLIVCIVSILFAYFVYACVSDSVSNLVGIISGVVVLAIGVGGSMYLSGKFGEKGLMQFRASKSVHTDIRNKYRLHIILADNAYSRDLKNKSNK